MILIIFQKYSRKENNFLLKANINVILKPEKYGRRKGICIEKYFSYM